MASKGTGKGEKQLSRIPSAVCPMCANGVLVPVTRTQINNTLSWVCPSGHSQPRSVQIVRVDPPRPPAKTAKR
jgi:hypothetical protein